MRGRFFPVAMIATAVAVLSQTSWAACPNFAAPVDYVTPNGTGSVVIADFNGDGKPDLAVVNHMTGNASILLGNGNGTFAAAVNYATGALPVAVATGDFNGDGKLDLAVVSNGISNNVSILLGNGNGTFAAPAQYGAGT